MTQRTKENAPSAPLSPATFQVLLALAGEDLHGYAILKAVERRAGDDVGLSTGTLYGILKRLLADGWIIELRSRPASNDDDARRRYYRLTARGREVAVAEAERLDRLVEAARSRRLLGKLRPA
jgi:DNA-binding PadR family transcriptional regulator